VFPARIGRHVGSSQRAVQGLHRAAAAGAVDQTHDREAKLARHLLGHDLLLHDRSIGCAATHREVIGGHHHGATFDPTAAEDEVRRPELLEPAVAAVPGVAADGSDLAEGVRVEEPDDALPRRQLAAFVLQRDLLLATHLSGQGFASAELVDFGLPAHCRPLSAALTALRRSL
jgi:phage tail protein X